MNNKYIINKHEITLLKYVNVSQGRSDSVNTNW